LNPCCRRERPVS